MTSIWAESVAAALHDALITLALAVGVCEGEVWQTSMWEVPARDPARPLTGPGGGLVTDAAERLALVQRFSTPWSVAWHALEVLDYDLTGDLSPWAGPPAPFADHPHWRDFTSLPRSVAAVRRPRLHRVLPATGTRHLRRSHRRAGGHAAARVAPPSRHALR